MTLGIFFYDQRNTQIYDAMVRRAKMLEALLELEPLDDARHRYAGAFLSRPKRTLLLFGVFRVWHDRGLAIVYGAVLGAWAFLITSSLLAFTAISSSAIITAINVGVPVIVAVAIIWQVHRWDEVTDEMGALPPRIQELIQVNPESGFD